LGGVDSGPVLPIGTARVGIVDGVTVEEQARRSGKVSRFRLAFGTRGRIGQGDVRREAAFMWIGRDKALLWTYCEVDVLLPDTEDVHRVVRVDHVEDQHTLRFQVILGPKLNNCGGIGKVVDSPR
jgi:hypothetical protein